MPNSSIFRRIFKKIITPYPLILTGIIILLDQLSKLLVIQTLPTYPQAGYSINIWGDFLRFTHVENTGVVFSIGHTLPETLKRILFIIIPLVALFFFLSMMLTDKSFTSIRRWALAAMVGGGMGNLVDRIFRSGAVVDFIDVKFYGIFGWERWPIFNIADASVVIASVFLIISLVFGHQKKHTKEDAS